MTRLGAASSVVTILPDAVVEQIIAIWEERANCQVSLDFGGGRCVGMRVIRAQRFARDDFVVDSVAGQD